MINNNALLNAIKNATNFTETENGGITHVTTMDPLLDMFAMCGSMRSRSDEDVILLFKKAYEYDPVYALKCLFWCRDVRGGAGERRFFRVCIHWLACTHPETMRRNLIQVPEYGRYDDWYALVDTPLEQEVFAVIANQLWLDMRSKTPSLLGKWLKSENASSRETKRLAKKTREALRLTSSNYRKILSYLRKKLNIVERLMSENRWDEIEFDKIPSKAGLIYKNAFARRDVLREKYRAFAQSDKTKVNADALYPYEVVHKANDLMNATGFWEYNTAVPPDDTNRLMINKYWANMKDYFAGSKLNALCMVDTSGSMIGRPMDVAISLGMYCAEKCKGPFANHYISFSSRPQLIEIEGLDFCDKVRRIYTTNLCENTNIEAAFDMILRTAIKYNIPPSEMPKNIIIVSDMEFDDASFQHPVNETTMEAIANLYERYGYRLPHLVFWNVDARQNNIPVLGHGRISYVSGFSPSIFKQIALGKSGKDLMLETLNSERYKAIE